MKQAQYQSEIGQLSVHLDYALRLQKWELDNFKHFYERTLSQRVMLALITANLTKVGDLRLTEIFVDSGGSEVGIRKCLKRFVIMGLIEIVRNPRDRRTKFITTTKQFQVILKAYALASNKLWKETQAKV
jgi:hypothetical protein